MSGEDVEVKTWVMQVLAGGIVSVLNRCLLHYCKGSATEGVRAEALRMVFAMVLAVTILSPLIGSEVYKYTS